MTVYVRIVDGEIVDDTRSSIHTDGDGLAWHLTESLSQHNINAGWQIAQETNVERPPDTDDTTWKWGLALVDGVAVHGWIEVPKTLAEIQKDIRDINRDILVDDAVISFGAVLAVIGTMNTILATPNADINANPALAIKALTRDLKTVTRQLARLARLTTGETDTIDVVA